ncbi:MAG: hypothetical protein KF886_10485 [Candidatus Hydrogenedentes bacterium]|nr:hypothetical protein [Candidatus Hydrogenedentota bacterium]
MTDAPRRALPGRDPDAGRAILTASAAVIGAALLLGLCYPLIGGRIYQGSDLGAYHFPVRSFYSQCLKNGQSFLWQPNLFCGYYLHGEGQAGMLHPFHLLIYRFLPLDVAFNLEFVSGYLMLYAGMAALLRRWGLPWFAALFGANVFTFSGFTLFHFIHLQAIAIIAHLPWMLLALDAYMGARERRAARWAWLALAFLGASQLLLGYPQYVLFTVIALIAGAARFVGHPGAFARLFAVGAALFTGLLLAGAQVLPTLDVLQGAQRSSNPEFWREGSLHPLNLLQWAGPWFFANGVAHGDPVHEYALYTGMIPVVLALSLLVRAPRERQRAMSALTCALLGGIALILALGGYGGLYGLLAQLPILGSFRCAARHIVLVQFALAALAAIALAECHTRGAVGGSRLARLAAVLALIALVAALAVRLYGGPARDDITDQWLRILLGPALLIGAAALVSFAPRWRTAGLGVLMALAATDIGLHALPRVWDHKPQSSRYEALRDALRDELPRDPAFTPGSGVYRAHGNWRVARLAPLGLPNYLGYVGLPPAWTLDPGAPVTRRVAGVRWEKQPVNAPDWTVNEDALPLARLVTQTVVSTTPRETIGRIDVATTALVERPLALPGGSPGALRWVEHTPGHARFETEASAPQLLVFAQRHHAGWRATVNGAPAEVLRVYGDFMGCLAPAGAAEIVFRFAPASLRYGLLMSASGLLFALAGAGLAGRAAGGRPSEGGD